MVHQIVNLLVCLSLSTGKSTMDGIYPKYFYKHKFKLRMVWVSVKGDK